VHTLWFAGDADVEQWGQNASFRAWVSNLNFWFTVIISNT